MSDSINNIVTADSVAIGTTVSYGVTCSSGDIRHKYNSYHIAVLIILQFYLFIGYVIMNNNINLLQL